ncbi:hypothetical protein DFH94DRAFT_737059 [Russula ochroleuca]|uniref:Copper acquisition factor BIM1-like domain-containing protein n=1 Tax=Russula ochroleuca TaxID=152965 RepID=A0A9P5MX47_9AGAM|nr:hypothetical protein DFH94DRAFT_737059 [Russula ochroleuca]
MRTCSLPGLTPGFEYKRMSVLLEEFFSFPGYCPVNWPDRCTGVDKKLTAEMRFSTFALLTGAITVVNAHFQLAFPPPRGPFDDDNEVNFCDNYINAVSNRSEFPLSGGFVTLNSEHPKWSLGILLSTAQDPTSFNNFTNSSGGQQLARNFASATGSGGFCIPLDLSNTGISGVSDGANVTLQFLYNGGDGNLYQCADLTLAQNFTIPSNITCSNSTATNSTSAASGITTTGYAGALGFLVSLFTV